MNLPKADYHYGQKVFVKNYDAGYPPFFEAVVCGVSINRFKEVEYTVMEPDGGRSDGYANKDLSAVPESTQLEKDGE